MKTYQDKRILNDKEWDVMVAEEGDHKVYVPFWPGNQHLAREQAQRMAELALRHERGESRPKMRHPLDAWVEDSEC